MFNLKPTHERYQEYSDVLEQKKKDLIASEMSLRKIVETKSEITHLTKVLKRWGRKLGLDH